MKCYKFEGTEEELENNVNQELHKSYYMDGCLIVIDDGYAWGGRNWWRELSNVERLVYSKKGVLAWWYNKAESKFEKKRITI